MASAFAEAAAALCERGLRNDSLLADELEAPLAAATVTGDADGGLVATVVRGEQRQGHVRMLVVDPDRRRRGLGAELLAAGEETLRAAGCDSVVVGGDAPDYLLPGVDVAEVEMLCLLEERRYQRIGASFNMDVDLSTLPPRPAGPSAAVPDDRDDVAAFCAAHWPNWADESLRALEKGTLVIGRDDAGITGFCAWDANRQRWLGPIAVRAGERGRGLGAPLLVEALHQMRERGYSSAEIAWVAPVAFYVKKAGATIGRTFLTYRKDLTRG